MVSYLLILKLYFLSTHASKVCGDESVKFWLHWSCKAVVSVCVPHVKNITKCHPASVCAYSLGKEKTKQKEQQQTHDRWLTRCPKQSQKVLRPPKGKLRDTSPHTVKGSAKRHISYKLPVHQQRVMKGQLFIYCKLELCHELSVLTHVSWRYGSLWMVNVQTQLGGTCSVKT